MITRKSFSNLNFIQKYDSCVLASYGVAAFPFVNRNITEFFKAYCKHYGVPITTQDGELEYNQDFHTRDEQKNKGGYWVIKNLHDTSSQNIFIDCKKAFSLAKVNASKMHLIDGFISKNDRLLNIFIHECYGLPINHSVTIGLDEDGYYMYDVNKGLITEGIEKLFDCCKMGDTHLIQRINI